MFTPNEKSAGSVVVSRKNFDAVPGRRARYIALYLIVVATWGVTTAGQMIALSRTNQETKTAGEAQDAAPSEAPEAGPAPPANTFRLAPSAVPTRFVVALYALRAVLLALFAVEFVTVLRTMGYPIVVVGAITIFVVLVPMPGLLAVAFIDRRISHAWNDANDALATANVEA